MRNLVNLEQTCEVSPIKDQFVASYAKQNFWGCWQKTEKTQQLKLSIEGPILLFFVNSTQIFSKGLLVMPINKV